MYFKDFLKGYFEKREIANKVVRKRKLGNGRTIGIVRVPSNYIGKKVKIIKILWLKN